VSDEETIAELKRVIEEKREKRRERYRAWERGLPHERLKERNEKKLEQVREIRARRSADPTLKAEDQARQRQYQLKNRKKLSEYSKWHQNNKLAQKAGRSKPEMCEVCNRGGRIMFDHCHDSDKFRGWICFNCNAILGLAADNITILEKLIIYLRTAENGQGQ
jgi:hypothetical protein